MAENAQEQLLGYLLNALEDDERQQLEHELADDPELRRQMETMRVLLRPLEPSRESLEPPVGLAQRTCRYVAAQIAGAKASRGTRPTPAGRLHAMRSDIRLDGSSSRFSWLDLVAVAGILVAASLLIFPALYQSRVQARTTQCAGNLYNLYQALALYSDAHAGRLPSAPPSDRLGGGGGFAAILGGTGYLNDPRQLICPNSPLAEQADFVLPTPEQINRMPEGPELEAVLASLGGSYSMSLGYEEDGRFHGLENRDNGNFALLSDVPDAASPDFRSHNHAGGRNVLLGGGNVRYMVLPVAIVGDDHVFLNADGRIGPGLHSHDSVIPPAGRLPIIFTSNRR
ncbi:MAG: hypothetical protein GXX96_14020 [Planctomycetaceae bacterium]|nr:hypothetical protein [Planctomycetaceae bacterium]